MVRELRRKGIRIVLFRSVLGLFFLYVIIFSIEDIWTILLLSLPMLYAVMAWIRRPLGGIKKFCKQKDAVPLFQFLAEHCPHIALNHPASEYYTKRFSNGHRPTNRHAVGKINARYRIVKLGVRYFIVDYSDPKKLRHYQPLPYLIQLMRGGV